MRSLVAKCLVLPICLAAAISAADRKLVRHPVSALFWADGTLKKGDTVDIDWNVPRKRGAKMCGKVVDVTPPVATIEITAIKRKGIGQQRIGAKITVNLSSKICGSCKGSARTSKVASLPARRTLTLDPTNATTSIMFPTSKRFGRTWDYDGMTMPALGKVTMQIDAPDPTGIARVHLTDPAQMPMGDFMFHGIRFSNFEKQMLQQQLFLDTNAPQDNLWGQVQLVHRFDALGKRWEMTNNAAIDGSWNLQTGDAFLSAFAGFSEPRIIDGPDARYDYYGNGCPGSNRATPLLLANGVPAFGTRLGLGVRNARPGAPALLTFGGNRVHIDLAPLGAPGCIVTTTAIFSLPTLVQRDGNAQILLPVPNDARLWGDRFQNQYLVFDAANRLGIVTTRGGQGTIGNR